MLRIAGQTAGPTGMKFFVDTYGWRYRLKKKQKKFNFFPRQRQALELEYYKNVS